MSTHLEKTLSDRLAELRQDGRFRLSQVAKTVGISESYLSKLESGERPTASRELCERLASFYNVPFSWLVNGEDTDPIKRAEAALAQELRASGLDQACRQTSETVAFWLRSMATSGPSHHERAISEIMKAVQGFREKCEAAPESVQMQANAIQSMKIIKLLIDFSSTQGLTDASMRNLWNEQLKKIKASIARGGQTALADYLGVTPQAVSQYLSGASAPSIEVGLRMILWVEEQAKQKRGVASAVTPTTPETRVRKTSKDEPCSDPKEP